VAVKGSCRMPGWRCCGIWPISAGVAPGGEVPVHRRPGRETVRQVPPGAPGPVQVQDRIDDRPQRPDPWPAAPPGHLSGQVRGDDLPLGIGQVTGIARGPLSGPAHTLGMRGPCYLFGLHTSRNTGPAPAHLITPATAPAWHRPATTGTSGHLSNTHLVAGWSLIWLAIRSKGLSLNCMTKDHGPLLPIFVAWSDRRSSRLTVRSRSRAA
jgi:hypothetical protein